MIDQYHNPSDQLTSPSYVITDQLMGGELTAEQIEESITEYNSFRENNDQVVKIGLYGEELRSLINDPETTLLEYEAHTGGKIFVPILVPASKLEWYNIDLLKRTYGASTEFLYYSHPPIPEDNDSAARVSEALKKVLDRGGLVFFDRYEVPKKQDSEAEIIDSLLDAGYEIENLGGGELQRTAETFVGTVATTAKQIKEAPSLFTTYAQTLEEGQREEVPLTGVSLSDVITGEDASRLWEIYKKPFDDLGVEHPAATGFREEGFMEILSDPDVTKIVNRVDGKISTLCIFVQDFDHCPWFNKKYFKDNYPDFYNTNNILIFPGIVSDENMRGSSYSLSLIKYATQLTNARGSDLLIAFECTETSAQYIPKIVTKAINDSGVATVSNLGEPISVTAYSALKKAN